MVFDPNGNLSNTMLTMSCLSHLSERQPISVVMRFSSKNFISSRGFKTSRNFKKGGYLGNLLEFYELP